MAQPINFGQEQVAASEILSSVRYNRMQTSVEAHLRKITGHLSARWISGFAISIVGTTLVADHNQGDAFANGKRYASPHKVKDTSNIVTTADAVSTLAELTSLLTECQTDYELHRASTTHHQAADTTNITTLGAPTTQAEAVAVIKELKKIFNAHRSQIASPGAHYVPDGKNWVTSALPDPVAPADPQGGTITIQAETTLAQAITAANEWKVDFNAHLNAEIMDAFEMTGKANGTYHAYIDGGTDALNVSLTSSPPANTNVLLASVVWTSPTLSALTDLRVTSNHTDRVHLATELRLGTVSAFTHDLSGTGTPEGSITAPIGSLFRRRDGGAGTSFYVKESGIGNTGWVAPITVAGAAVLSSITAAVAANSINNGDNAQVWNWSLTTAGKIAMRFSENVAGVAGGTPVLIQIDTLAASTVLPLLVKARAVDALGIGATGKVGIGAAASAPAFLAHVKHGSATEFWMESGTAATNYATLTLAQDAAGGAGNFAQITRYSNATVTLGIYNAGALVIVSSGTPIVITTSTGTADANGLTVQTTGQVTISSTTVTGEVRLRELVANGSNYVGWKSPDSLAANQIWTLPTADGSSGQFLQTNGAGVLSWAAITAHNVLSATHADSLAAAVVRGDLIIGNATPLWARLALGAANSILSSNGTDPSWSATPRVDRIGVGVAADGSAAINLATNGQIAEAGAAPKRTLFVSAAGMWPSTTSGCAALAKTELATNKVNQQTLDFDQTVQEYAEFAVQMPGNWNAGTITFVIDWTTTAGAATQVVRWLLQATALADDDAIDTAWGTAIALEDTWLANNDNHITTESGAVTVGNAPAAGDWVQFRVSRDAAHANDTLGGDAKLRGIRILYGISKYGH